METPFVVGLGASAGGLGALERFFKKVSTDTGAAFVVVVHPSPDFESLMPELLSRHTEMPVEAVTDGAAVLADRVYIIPPRSSMELRDGQLCLVAPDRSPGRDLNLPINLFFFSLARDAGARSAAVVLSGAGTDGSGGLPAVAQQGGTILVQDPTDAQFDGMPRAALETGLVDVVGQVEQLAETIGHLTRPPGASDDGSPPAPGSRPAEERERRHARIEARHPSCRFLGATTVSRRVSRRAQLAGQADVESYLDLLTTNPQELDALRRDLFVGFTSFFRDPRAFESLRQEALPQLLADGSTDPLRIWVPACSTGQEVYTLVMCCLEALEAAGQNRHLKVFATDVNERALPFASRGIYSAEEVAWLPEGLLAKYFEPRGVEFVVSPRIRSGVIFSSHNVVEDAPFGRMDLVSCRNLLIYLTDAAKQETLRSLVSALKPDRGILMLGASEMPTPFEPYVDAISSARRLYRRGSKSPPLVKPRPLPSPDPTGGVRDRRDTLKEVRTAAELKTLRQALGASFAFDARSAALIDDENRLLTVLHDAQGLFKLPTGDASLHVERILPAPHAAALWSARNHLREGHPHPVPVVTPDGAPALDLRLVPLEVPEGSAPKLLLVIGA
ncbi:MAG: chemotaxis protein CheB, partial [Myxococcota bacterium]